MTNKKIKNLQNTKISLAEHKLDDGTIVKLNPTVTRIVLFDNKNKIN
ncbi:hypothetical protein [Brachyspira hampsonii]|nr:hypothetical protein [Brachyspira hampsonii]ELV05767.1 hypothetical protein H263_08254 [Brachyspira hampsonii 30599]